MRAFLALIGRDLRLAARAGGDGLTLVLFFVMVGALMPFAIGPDRVELARLAPGIVWLAAFLALLLGLDRLFRADEDDGTLLLFRHAAIPLEAIVGGKVVAHWLLTAIPVLIASPLLAILLSMDAGTWGRTVLALLLGTPALTAFGGNRRRRDGLAEARRPAGAGAHPAALHPGADLRGGAGVGARGQRGRIAVSERHQPRFRGVLPVCRGSGLAGRIGIDGCPGCWTDRRA